MAEYIIQEETLVGIADAIRSKTGESGQVAVADMAEKISEIAVDEKVETTVVLDFSEGDMQLAPEDGTVFSSVNIPAPATLVPENIAEGVDIAGVIGTLAASGSSLKIATGETSATGSPLTITHGLGMMPDFIYFGTKANTQGVRKFLCAYGFSAAFIELTGDKLRGRYVVGEQTNFLQGVNNTVESTASSYGIFNATATTFQVAGNSNYPVAKILGSNQWVAIGGLT